MTVGELIWIDARIAQLYYALRLIRQDFAESSIIEQELVAELNSLLDKKRN